MPRGHDTAFQTSFRVRQVLDQRPARPPHPQVNSGMTHAQRVILAESGNELLGKAPLLFEKAEISRSRSLLELELESPSEPELKSVGVQPLRG